MTRALWHVAWLESSSMDDYHRQRKNPFRKDSFSFIRLNRREKREHRERERESMDDVLHQIDSQKIKFVKRKNNQI